MNWSLSGSVNHHFDVCEIACLHVVRKEREGVMAGRGRAAISASQFDGDSNRWVSMFPSGR